MDKMIPMLTDKPKKPIYPVLVVAVILLAVGAASAVFVWQIQRSSSLRTQQGNLSAQLTAVQKQKTQLQSARTISTTNWKLECDAHNNLCFQLPPDWNSNSFDESSDGIGGLQSTNPSKSLMVSYRNHYIQDGGSATFHVASITNISDSSLKLQIVGGYYVAENRQPFYIVVGNEQVSNYGSPLKVGQNVVWGNTERFETAAPVASSAHDDIQFTANAEGQTFPSSQSADAWFGSINGLTALKIMESLVSGSSYTGSYLNITEVGLRIGLTYNTADAYYSINNSPIPGQPFIRLTVHSLDAYPGCSLGQDGIAIISSFTKGATDPIVGDMMTAYPKAPLVNGRYYFIAGAQAPCSNDPTVNQEESNAKHDFVNAYQTIESIKKQ